MYLKEIASLLVLSEIKGSADVEFTGIQVDSRKIKPGDLFICLSGIPGHTADGHAYAASAVAEGAAAVVAEREVNVNVPVLIVKDSRFAAAVIVNHYYGYPTEEMKLIGVTGTNGKTTTTYLIEKIIKDQGYRTGLMGTIRMKIGDQSVDVKNTTQDTVDLQRNFRSMREAGADYCIMEVSSHALEMGRVKGCRFRTAIFTNLTQDHLDYHKTMEAYKEAKGLFFSRLGNAFSAKESERRYAVLNADDAATDYFRSITSAEVITYGIRNEADVRATDIQMTAQGTQFAVHSFKGYLPFQLKLVGQFNVYNALAAIAAALLEGISLEEIRSSLEQVEGVDGRMERVFAGQDFLVLVDYAHTPDSLENVLSTIRGFAKGNVYCVFGCGGDRDRTKRPLMGAIAAKYSDYLFVTSDNPRSEDPEAILQDIVPGIEKEGFASERYELIADRRTAIQKAVEKASANDVVLIAGKGHEPYQTIKGVNHFFDDRLEAKEAIRSLAK